MPRILEVMPFVCCRHTGSIGGHANVRGSALYAVSTEWREAASAGGGGCML